MRKDEISEQLLEIVMRVAKAAVVEGVVIADETTFEKDLGIDSIGFMQMVIEVEEKFNIVVDEYRFAQIFSSYGSLREYVIGAVLEDSFVDECE